MFENDIMSLMEGFKQHNRNTDCSGLIQLIKGKIIIKKGKTLKEIF